MSGAPGVEDAPRRLADGCLFAIEPDAASAGVVRAALSGPADAAVRRLSGGRTGAASVVVTAACCVLLRRYLGSSTVVVDVRRVSDGHDGWRTVTVPMTDGSSLRDLLTTCRHSIVSRAEHGDGRRADVAIVVTAQDDCHPDPTDHDLVIRLVRGSASSALELSAPGGVLPAWFRTGLAADLDTILGLLGEPSRPLGTFDGMLERRVTDVVAPFNDTARPFPTDATVLDLFRGRIQDRPDGVAVVGGDTTLTYGELDTITRRLARHLRGELGVRPGQVVAGLPDRDHRLPVMMLGIMAAGAVYLPLHPEWPPDRTHQILRDAGAAALVTRGGGQDAGTGLPVVDVDELREGFDDSEVEVGHAPGPADPAYLIFTSGTTGSAKGVLVAHRGLVNTVVDHIDRFAITPDDRYLQFMAVSFDAVLLDVFMTLCAGATLVIASSDTIRDPARFARLLDGAAATLSTITPSYLGLLDPSVLARLRVLVSAGEVLGADLAARLSRVTTVYNGYGPTEATVNSTLHRVDPDRRQAPVPIGPPSANKSVRVLDEHLRQQPIGVLGEICIGGTGLAECYINDPELTASKFVADPFGTDGRLYRTGDYGAWTPDGDILFQGRADDQVKVNGHRIDLQEIQEAVLAHAAVRTALVTTTRTDHGGTEIVAFHQSTLSAGDLAEHLDTRIAPYMRPHRMVAVPDWPLTRHGKTDGRALRSLAANPGPVVPATDVAPGRTEQCLLEIWAQVLDRPVGVGDAVHVLGADSLRMIQMAQLAQRRGIELEAAEILRKPTIRELARWLDDRGAPVPGTISAGMPAGLVEPAPQERALLPDGVEDAHLAAQMQSFMIERYAADTTGNGAYLGTAEWTFTDPDLDEAAVVEAIGRLWTTRRSLRITFLRSPLDRDVVLVRPPRPLTVPVHDLTGLSRSELDDHFRREIDRETGRRFDPYGVEPLVRFRLYRTGADSVSVFFTFHHALLDGWSGVELRNALWEHYLAARENAPTVPATPGSYREFVALEQEILGSESARRFWLGELDRPAARAAVSTGRTVFATGGPRITVETAFPADTGRAVYRHSRDMGVSLKAVYLAAVCRALSETFGVTELVTAVVTNGRSERLTEPMRSTGLFWNIVPFVTTSDQARTAPRVQQRLDAIAPFGAFPLRAMENNFLDGSLAAPIFNFVHFHNAGEGSRKFAEGIVQSRFHFPLTFFVKCIGDAADGVVRMRIDADPTILSPTTVTDLWDHVHRVVRAAEKGNR